MAGKRSGYKYRRRSARDVQNRASQVGGDYDSIFVEDVGKPYQPAEGDNTVRIMPPTFEGADHYGIDVYVHYGIGPDRDAYLCLDSNVRAYMPEDIVGDDKCPLCAAHAEAVREGDEALANALKPKKRCLVWIIDRDREKDGPKVWTMPWTVDKDIALVSVKKRTGEVIPIDHPEEGFDLDFTRTGQGRNTKYAGFRLDSEETPLHDDDRVYDEWMQTIEDLPVDKVLRFFSADHIRSKFEAQPTSRDDDDDRPKSRRSRRGGGDEEEREERPRSRRSRRETDDDEDERPRSRRRGRGDDEDEDDEPRPRRRRSRDEDDDEDAPRPRRRRVARDEDDDEPRARRRRGRDDDDDEDQDDDPRPRRRGRARDDDDEEGASGRGRDDDDEPEQERPRRRRRRGEDADDTAGERDDEEEKPRRRERIRDGLRGRRRGSDD